MASYGIHFAIVEEYLKLHQENRAEFIKGTIDVDLAIDKIKSHYTGITNHDNLIEFLNQKVVLANYVKENEINTSYDRGYFLHLLTDYYFYTTFFDKEWLQSINYSEFKQILYNEYPVLNPLLKSTYKIQYPEIIEKYDFQLNGENKILTEEKIKDFINKMSLLNIKELYSFIKNTFSNTMDIIKSENKL